MMKNIYLACGAVAVVSLAACQSMEQGTGQKASANLESRSSSNAKGSVNFIWQGNDVLVTGNFSGLKPNSEHGFNVHEKGDCSSGDGMSTGGHFNPTGHAHGAHGQGMHHAGDLPSLAADAQGVARFSFETTSLTVGQGATDVVGRGLIVHRDPDDFKTQPTGNSGARIACAVITRS